MSTRFWETIDMTSDYMECCQAQCRKLEHHHCSYAKNILVINIWASGCIRSVARIITQASDNGWVYNNRSDAHTHTHNRQKWLHMKGLDVSLSKNLKEIITQPEQFI